MTPPWLFRSRRGALLVTALLFSAGYAAVGLVLILLTVVVEAIRTRTLPWRRSPVDWFLLSFIAAFVISGVASSYRAVAVGSTALAALTIYLTFGPLYDQLQRDKGFLRPFLSAWVAGGIAAAVWAIILRTPKNAAYTPALGENAVGTTLLVALVLSLGLLLALPAGWRYLVMGGWVLIILGLAFTYARGAWLGAATGLIAFLLLARLRYRSAAIVLLLLIGALGILFTLPENNLLLETAATIPALSRNRDRIAQAKSALAIYRDHPLVGTGLNTFTAVYPAYRLPDDPSPTSPFAHNIFLNMAAEGGALGLATFTATILWSAVAAWRWRTASQAASEIMLSAAIFAALLGLIVNQLFDGTILSVHLSSGLWFLIAIVAAHAPQDRRPHAGTARTSL